MEDKTIEVNGVTIELTEGQVNKILEQTKVKDTKELVKQEKNEECCELL